MTNTMLSTVDALATPEIDESWDVERIRADFPCASSEGEWEATDLFGQWRVIAGTSRSSLIVAVSTSNKNTQTFIVAFTISVNAQPPLTKVRARK
jgi:hypothetical protein